MKKVLTVILIVLGSLAGAALLFVGGVALNGTCFRDPGEPDERLSRWMGELPDDLRVCEIVMPGSHDAGTNGMIWPGETQNTAVKEQMLFGARYFDLRVHRLDDGKLVIYHDILDGTDFLPILGDIRAFLEEHPTETLLLDFQHFSGSSQRDVFDALTEELDSRGMLLKYDDDELDEVEFISRVTLGEARGKAIVFFGDRSWYEGDFIFHRNNDSCSEMGMALDSCYDADLHKSGTGALLNEAFPKYFALEEEKTEIWGPGIFVLQAQLTDGRTIFGPWSLKRRHDGLMSEYIRNLKNDPENLCRVNVIMRDFLTPQKCEEIIELNKAKAALRYSDD